MIRRLTVLLAVAVALVGVVLVAPGGLSPARADDDLDRSCSTSLGGTLPVVFVHGWRSSPQAWDSAAGEVLSPSVTTFQFDYEKQHTNWVNDPNIGSGLAELILCLGRNSELLGGPGKVVVVGHSMGGLAIRCALQFSCSRVVGAEAYVAQVITIGTPTHGSFLRYGGTIGNVARMALNVVCEAVRTPVTGRPPALVAEEKTLCEDFLSNDAAVAFNDGSTELQALRADNTQTPVLAIAGDIKLDLAVLFGRYTVAHGDAVVDKRSQQSWATETGNVDCGRIALGGSVTDFGYAVRGDDDQFSNYKCWHGAETWNAEAIRLIRDKVNLLNAALDRNEGCNADDPAPAVCRVVRALVGGDLGGLSETERRAAEEVTDGVPVTRWRVDGCEVVGDITSECLVLFDAFEGALHGSGLTFYVQPTNGTYDVMTGQYVVPDGEEIRYEVVGFAGYGP